MRLTLRMHVATMLVATSYITLGIFAPEEAGEFWWLYAIVTFIMASLDILLERKDVKETQERKELRAKNRRAVSSHHA